MRSHFHHFMLYVPVVAALLAVDARGADQLPPPLPAQEAAGTILSETKRPLGNGYFKVQRSQVNPPGHWEGVGHFGFIYFGDEKLCQCSTGEISISPQGEFALYVAQDGRLMLFRAATKSRKALSKRFDGHPIAADWEISRHRVSVTLEKYVNDRSTKSTRVVHF